jgi:DNA-binding NarL/FixJ family response regulator
MRIAVVGRSRWAAQGVAAALASPLPDAAAAAEDWQVVLVERWPPWPPAAGEAPWSACVALVDDADTLGTLLAALPPELPLLVLGEALATPAPPAATRRPTGWLGTHVSDQRLRAALAALLHGLSVHEAGHAAVPPAPMPASPADTPIEPLTPRELEVYELLAKGLSNRDIAAALDISAHTAKFHVAQILDKTGAATRAEAVSLGLRLGLIGF